LKNGYLTFQPPYLYQRYKRVQGRTGLFYCKARAVNSTFSTGRGGKEELPSEEPGRKKAYS
jgi:hypothetical protein